MKNSQYLNEEKFQKTKRKISKIALIIFMIGCLIGGSLIFVGINKNKEVELKFSEDKKIELSNQIQEKKTELSNQIQNEKENLEKMIKDLENQGIKYDVTAKYTDGKAYELKLLVNVLDPSFGYYKFDEYQNNTITSKYCALMSELDTLNDGNDDLTRAYDELNSEAKKSMEKGKNINYFAFGGMTILFTLMISGSVTMMSKGREIAAYQAQQVMPIAQEGLEKMAPSITKVSKTMAEEMAPTYGKIAKEIAKGVKEGLDNKNDNNEE